MPTSTTPCAAISAVAAPIRASARPFIWRLRIPDESGQRSRTVPRPPAGVRQEIDQQRCRRRGIISLVAGMRAVMDIAQWEFAHVPTTGVRRAHETPIVLATEASLGRLGRLVDDSQTFPLHIVRPAAQAWRPRNPNFR